MTRRGTAGNGVERWPAAQQSLTLPISSGESHPEAVFPQGIGADPLSLAPQHQHVFYSRRWALNQSSPAMMSRLAWLHDTIVAKAGGICPAGGVAQAAFIPMGHGLLQARWNQVSQS